MGKKIIRLTTQEDLKIFMSPQRQKLLRLMRIESNAMTAKAIADKLKISTSSAQFHIRKLVKLGIVELDHTQTINGILAKYYRIASVTVNIETNLDHNLPNEQNVIMQNLMKGTFEGLVALHESGLPKEEIEKNSEFVNGFINLTREDAQMLLRMIQEFIETHGMNEPNTQVWEYTLLLYNTAATKEE